MRLPHVQLDVSKAVEVDDLAANLAMLRLGLGNPELEEGGRIDSRAEALDRHSGGHQGGCRTERVPRAERGGDRLDDDLGGGDLERTADAPVALPRQREEAVVWSDEDPAALDLDGHLAVLADVWVDDGTQH